MQVQSDDHDERQQHPVIGRRRRDDDDDGLVVRDGTSAGASGSSTSTSSSGSSDDSSSNLSSSSSSSSDSSINDDDLDPQGIRLLSAVTAKAQVEKMMTTTTRTRLDDNVLKGAISSNVGKPPKQQHSIKQQQQPASPTSSTPSPPKQSSSLPPSLTTACDLVQSILNQMSLKDAPPINDHHYSTLSSGAPVVVVPRSPSPKTAVSLNHNRITSNSSSHQNQQQQSSTMAVVVEESSLRSSPPRRTSTTTRFSDGSPPQPTVGTDGKVPSFDDEQTASDTTSSYYEAQQQSHPQGKNLVSAQGTTTATGMLSLSASSQQSSTFPEGHPVPLYRQLYHQEQYGRPGDKLGHKALATLCHWTLQILSVETTTTKTGIPRQIEMGKTTTGTIEQQQPHATTVLRTSSSGIGSHHGSAKASSSKSGGSGVVRITPWRNKKKQLLPPTHHASHPPHHNRSASNTGSAAAAVAAASQRVRLQMFGSEYARHLSTSALAPNSPNNNNNHHCASPTHGGSASTGAPPNNPHHHATPSMSDTRKSRRGSSYKKSSSSSFHQSQPQPQQQAPSSQSSSSNRLPPFVRPAMNIEEAAPAVQTGAILDIIVTTDSQPPPTGYYRIGTTVSGRPFSLKAKNSKSSSSLSSRSSSNQGTKLYLNVKKETSWDKAAQRPCITALTVIFPDRQEFVPPGFCIVRNGKVRHTNNNNNAVDGGASTGSHDKKEKSDKNAGQPADIGGGGGSERVFLCFRRSREGNPITSIVPLSPSHQEDVPEGYTVVERTPRNFCANLNPKNSGSSGNEKALFLAYRQRLANLETLRPLPLILSVPSASTADKKQHQSGVQDEDPGSVTPSPAASTPTWLQSYYATGGTVVSAQVGRFHIMDRSTHSLLSPSSVANRLALIEKSRQQAGKKTLPVSSIRGDDLSSAVSAPRSRAGSLDSEDAGTANRGGGGGTDSGANSTTSLSEHGGGGEGNATTSSTRLNTSLAGEDSSVGDGTGGVGDDFISLSSIFRINNGRNTPGSTGMGAVHGHSLFCVDEAEAQRYIQAMSFIPIVESAVPADATIALRLQARTTLITPIFTACYNRHGGSALVAVEGLFGLLKAGFFQDDVDLSDDANNMNGAGDTNSCGSASPETHDESSTRLTLLDLAIQVVCDVATTGAQETTFGACVEFVETAVRFSQAQLNTRTIGYVVRFYLFVFYFGASVPTASMQQWPNPAWAGTAKHTVPVTSISSMSSMTDDLNHADGGGHGGGGAMLPPTETFENSILFDPRSIQPSSTKAAAAPSTYLPGGAPQAAALAFKELISLSIVRLGKISVNDILITCAESSHLKGSMSDGGVSGIAFPASGESLAHLLENLLSDVVDDAVDHVDRANYTQLALHQIHRSGGSELFWHDMINACGAGLFGKDPSLTDAGRAIYIMIFAVMSNLVKVSSGKIRGNCTAELMPRDVASKLFALELLLHFLEYWSDEQEAVSGMDLMTSEQPARVVSVDTLAFTIRRMVVPCLLSNTKTGLEDPEVFKRVIKIVTELWRSPIYRSHCKAELGILVDHFALRLLEMGPQLIASTKVDLWSDQAHVSFRSQQMDLLKELKNMFLGDPKDSIEFYLNYDTDLTAQTTGPTHLLPGSRWKLFQRLCAGLCSIAEQCSELIGHQIAEHRAKISSRPQDGPFASDDSTQTTPTDKAAVRESARLLRTSSLEAISQIVRAIAISVGATKGPKFTSLFLSWAPVGSPIAYETLLSSSRQEQTEDEDDFDDHLLDSEDKSNRYKSNVENHALDVAAELAKQKSLKKAVEYLIACNALTPAPRDIATYLRMHKSRFDPAALGQYLGECGVGGAETEYWNSIRLSYVRAISFLGMNVDEALRHFLTNGGGFHLPGEAQKIDRIINTFAQCFFEDNAGDALLCPFKNEDTVYLLCFAIIMLNTDLHKACSPGSRRHKKKMTKQDFINNLRGVEQGEDIPRDYLSGIYDSIEACPIVLDDDTSRGSAAAAEDQHKSLQDMLNNTRGAESLLRGLAVHDFRFATIEDLAEILRVAPRDALAKLTKSLVSETWHQWHSVISTCLETAHLDLQGMEPCVDILLYALSITVCLDMKTERSAFLGQLGRLKSFEELRQGRWVHAPDYESFRGEAWYLELEEACCGSEDRRIWALRNIREWMESVQEELLDDVRNKAELTKVCAQLEKGDTLLQDPARSFVRAGKLTKKSGRTGRSTEYHFILFSDLLLYSKGDVGGKYKIHEELPLHLTKVVDWFPSNSQKNKQQNVFEIHHPRKSFQVVCRSVEERKSWVKDIREAILMEVERKMMLEAARLAVHTKA